MVPKVLVELRLLASARLDSHILLTVVLAGDGRLIERFRTDELLPLGSRFRVRMALERASPEELQEWLKNALTDGRHCSSGGAHASAIKLRMSRTTTSLCRGSLSATSSARATSVFSSSSLCPFLPR